MLRIVDLNAQVVTDVFWKVPLSLHTGGGWIITIDSEVAVTDAGGDRFVFSGGDQAAPKVLAPELGGRIIDQAMIDMPGRIRLDFADGSQLTAPAAPDFEGWRVTSPDGERIVCLAGGEVAVQSGGRPT